MNALHFSATWNHLDCVKFLVEEVGTKVLVKDKFRRSPLIMAIKNGNIQIASYLL